MNAKTDNKVNWDSHKVPDNRVFFFEHPNDPGTFIGCRFGESKYSTTTIYDGGHCAVMNARQGHTAAEVAAAIHCNIMGHWDSFEDLVKMEQESCPVFSKGMVCQITLEDGSKHLVEIKQDDDGLLCTVFVTEAGAHGHAGIYSYLTGQGLLKHEGCRIDPKPA